MVQKKDFGAAEGFGAGEETAFFAEEGVSEEKEGPRGSLSRIGGWGVHQIHKQVRIRCQQQMFAVWASPTNNGGHQQEVLSSSTDHIL